MIQEQDAVQMIHLMLQAHGQRPSASSVCALPCSSRYSALMDGWRSTSSQISGTDRQPSSMTCISSEAQVMGGLMKTRGFSCRRSGQYPSPERAWPRRPGWRPARCLRPRTWSRPCRRRGCEFPHPPVATGSETALRRGSGAVRMGRMAHGWEIGEAPGRVKMRLRHRPWICP